MACEQIRKCFVILPVCSTDGMPGVTVHPKSGFSTAAGSWMLAEDDETGDCGWVLTSAGPNSAQPAFGKPKKQLISNAGTRIFRAFICQQLGAQAPAVTLRVRPLRSWLCIDISQPPRGRTYSS